MKARVRFAITGKDGGNGGRGSMVISYSDRSRLSADVVDRLRNSSILRLGEGVKLEILELPEQSMPDQEIAAVALMEGGESERF